MRSYEIYKIKQDYLSFIIGREKLLYDLLMNQSEDTMPLKEVEFLCEKIPFNTIQNVMNQHFSQSISTINGQETSYQLTHPVKGSIYISHSPYFIRAFCEGSRMLDLDLFIALSHSTDQYFAIMEEYREWGWLKPIRTSEYYLASSHS